MQETFVFHHDPGHGWLQVPKRMLSALGVKDKISSYSYMDDEYAYLEEDCDMGVFVTEAERRGITIQYTSRYQRDTPIRNMSCFRPE